MIRFIDLGDQILEGTKHFAWFDTITDSFETYGGDQVWTSWKEFEESYAFHNETELDEEFETRPLSRYRGLFRWREGAVVCTAQYPSKPRPPKEEK